MVKALITLNRNASSLVAYIRPNVISAERHVFCGFQNIWFMLRHHAVHVFARCSVSTLIIWNNRIKGKILCEKIQIPYIWRVLQTLTPRESLADFVEPVCFSDGPIDRALHHWVHCWRQTCWMYSLQYTTLLLHNDLSHVERCRRS